jgi:lipid-binding SYLF domain-containing protein
MPAFAPRPTFLRSVVLLLGLALSTVAIAGANEDERARNAVRVLTEIQAIPESAIPDKLLDEARAIVVVPDTIKAGLVIGGRRGHGLMSVKAPDGTWSNPSFVTLTGGSIGLQVGVQSADVVLAFRTERGLESIVNGKFTLGADAGVAAGPLGRHAATATDGELKAEIWSWSRARGLFAGVALDGAVLQIDDAANQAVYGAGTTPRMIFEGRANAMPSPAIVAFRDQLEEATALARSNRGTDTPAPAAAAGAEVGVTSATTATTTPVGATPPESLPAEAGTGIVPPASDPADAMFEPVDDNPATTEPLPPVP